MSTHMLTEQNHRLAKMLLEQQGELNKARARVAELEGREARWDKALGARVEEVAGLQRKVEELEGERSRLEACLRVNREANASKDTRTIELQAKLDRANRVARLHENKLFLLDECLRGSSDPKTRISSALTLVRSEVESDGT